MLTLMRVTIEKLPPLSQILKITFIIFFLLLTPFIPTSLKSSYLYFLINILVLVLGIESGFLKSLAGPRDDKKSSHSPPPYVANPNFDVRKISTITSTTASPTVVNSQTPVKQPVNQKAKVETPLGGFIRVKKLERCPSRPTIFFIGGLESDGDINEEKKNECGEEEKEEEYWMEADEMMSKHELFTKAESFIGNFYRQLKMQRKESWNKIHELYNTAL